MTAGVRQFTSTPITVDALQWTGDNQDEVRAFLGGRLISIHDRGWVFAQGGAGGVLRGEPGYWIVCAHGTETLAILPAVVFEQLYVEDPLPGAVPRETETASSCDIDVEMEAAGIDVDTVDPTLADA